MRQLVGLELAYRRATYTGEPERVGVKHVYVDPLTHKLAETWDTYEVRPDGTAGVVK